MNQPTRITFRIDAGPDERYTEQFAQSLIGQTPHLVWREHEDGPVLADYGTSTVVAAEVIDDGAAVLITYEAPAGAQGLPALTDLIEVGLAERLEQSLPAMSFRFIEAEPAEARDQPKTPSRITPAEAIAALDAINPGVDACPGQAESTDPEAAHAQADLILLRAVPVEVADAYQRLVEQRISWWAYS